MKHIKNSVVVITGMLVVIGLITFLIPAFTQGQPGGPPANLPPEQNVTVVNSASNPVPVTGTVNVGNEPVGVTGTINVGNVVQFQPAIPAGAFSLASTVNTGGSGLKIVLFGPDPGSTNYAITSFTVANIGDSVATLRIFVDSGITSDCFSFVGSPAISMLGPAITVPAGETIHLSFPQPFVVAPQSAASSCLIVHTALPAIFDYAVVGYRF